MTMVYCMGLGTLLVVMGLVGSMTGGHPHVSGVFGINFLHNVLHLMVGFMSLAAVAAGPRHVKMFCLEVGAFFAVLALFGLSRDSPIALLLNLRSGDTWLYGILAMTSLGFGLGSKVALRLRNAVDSQTPHGA